MENSVDGLENRFQSVVDSDNTVEVDFLSHSVSDSPIISREIENCVSAIVLSSANYAGVSHYDTPNFSDKQFETHRNKYDIQTPSECHHPEDYIPDLVNNLRKLAPQSRLGYVVVGGSESLIKKIKNVFKDLEIPLIGEFCDIRDGGNVEKAHFDKSVVAIPNTREAIMYSKPTGYKQWPLDMQKTR